jgi:Ni,Fe-hydrogenase maturation factor
MRFLIELVRSHRGLTNDQRSHLLLAHILQRNNAIMASQKEIAAEMQSLAMQVAKISQEVQGLLATLSTVADPELEAALAALRDQIQAADNLLPDA